jgi:hypothetical protein
MPSARGLTNEHSSTFPTDFASKFEKSGVVGNPPKDDDCDTGRLGSDVTVPKYRTSKRPVPGSRSNDDTARLDTLASTLGKSAAARSGLARS